MVFIGGIAIQDSILCDEAVSALGQKNLVAELDRFIRLAALDQVGMGLKDRVDFFGSRDLFSINDTPTSLIHDTASQATQVADLFTHGFDQQRIRLRFAAGVLGCIDRPLRIV